MRDLRRFSAITRPNMDRFRRFLLRWTQECERQRAAGRLPTPNTLSVEEFINIDSDFCWFAPSTLLLKTFLFLLFLFFDLRHSSSQHRHYMILDTLSPTFKKIKFSVFEKTGFPWKFSKNYFDRTRSVQTHQIWSVDSPLCPLPSVENIRHWSKNWIFGGFFSDFSCFPILAVLTFPNRK
jgi:hypothetical protein